jgi:type IV secretory pathway ATPase VirB11/archaellum biosynthesis ATPase
MNLTKTGQYSDAATLSESDVAQLAKRLEEDDYETPFAALDDWHLLRSIAFQRPDLVKPYLYLLDLEAFDES